MPLAKPATAEQRIADFRQIRRLLVEKLPFFGLSIISCVLTVWAQKSGGSVKTLAEFPLLLRLENALISYIRYLKKFFWPSDLAVFYPHPNAWPAWHVALAIIILAAATFLAIRLLRKAPFLCVGWFWFLGMLIPVIGIVQVGIQSMADRYTYLPMIGFTIALVWGTARWMERARIPASGIATFTAIALGACLLVTNQQTAHWRDSEALFRQALRVTERNYTAHVNLGIALAKAGKLDESEQHLRAALEIGPNYVEAYHNLANTLVQSGKLDEARTLYLEAIRMQPNHGDAIGNLGLVAARLGHFEEAKTFYSRAADLKPADPVLQHNLATALLELGEVTEAIVHYGNAVELNPDFAPSHFQLGTIFAANDYREQAIFHFRETLRVQPEHGEARQQLALLGE